MHLRSHKAAEMTALPALPNELWTQAFEYLGKADLKTVRLCGKRQWEILASPLLFTTAYVAARRGVLDTFTELTTHPVLRNYVKQVVFDSSWLDPGIVESYEDNERGGPLGEMYSEQERIQESELQSRLDSAFQNLCSVKRVYYANMSKTSCLPGDQNDPSWCSDYDEGPLSRRIESLFSKDVFCACGMRTGSKLEGSLRLAAEEDPNGEHSDEVAESHCRFRRKQGGLIILMQALSKHATGTLVDLSLGDTVNACGADAGITPMLFSAGEPADTHPFFLSVFRCLRKLDLTISNSTLPQREPVDLVEFLSPAKSLEELKIVGKNGGLRNLNPANTLGNCTWPRLRVIFLVGFEIKQSQLDEFLYRHASSLKNMTLDNFRLVQGTWKAFVANVPKIAPEVQIILGAVASGNKWIPIERLVPLGEHDVLFGSLHCHRHEGGKCGDGAEGDEEDDNDTKSSSDDLEYSSDDSSSETDEPRRKPDASLLTGMDAKLRHKVEYLQHELPGCPVQECLIMLDRAKNDQNLARKALIKRFEYDELDAMSLEMRDKLPFDCSATEVKEALERCKGDKVNAKRDLRDFFGHRQKIVMG